MCMRSIVFVFFPWRFFPPRLLQQRAWIPDDINRDKRKRQQQQQQQQQQQLAHATHNRYRIPKENPEKDWYVDYSIDLKVGRECCSRNSLSFHYVDEKLMRRLYHLVYSCPKEPVSLSYA